MIKNKAIFNVELKSDDTLNNCHIDFSLLVSFYTSEKLKNGFKVKDREKVLYVKILNQPVSSFVLRDKDIERFYKEYNEYLEYRDNIDNIVNESIISISNNIQEETNKKIENIIDENIKEFKFQFQLIRNRLEDEQKMVDRKFDRIKYLTKMITDDLDNTLKLLSNIKTDIDFINSDDGIEQLSETISYIENMKKNLEL